MWIARATHEANNQSAYPFQDSEAARWKSEEAAAERRKSKALRSKRLLIIDRLKMMKLKKSPAQGGHTVEEVHGGGVRSRWNCIVCKTSLFFKPRHTKRSLRINVVRIAPDQLA